MIRLELRCAPASGRADLSWLADLTGSLDDIHDFLLRAEITERVERERALTPAELATVVDGHAVEHGSPIVHLREGSMIIELVARLVDSTIPVQVLASLALLFAKGPEAAAWPGHVRKAWYDSRTEADRARQAYMQITSGSTVDVVGDTGTGDPEDPDGAARQQPGPPVRRPARARRPRAGDLPTGVRTAAPLSD